MQTSKLTRLAAAVTLTALLAGCNASSSDSTTAGSTTGGSTGGTTGGSTGGTSTGGTSVPAAPRTLILDSTQGQVSSLLRTLGANVTAVTPAGSPLDVGGFLIALDPTLNNLLDGPDAVLTGLLDGVRTLINNPGPAGVQAAAGQIQEGLTALPPAVTGLAQDLPCALATLAGNRAAVCSGTNPAAQLQSLIAQFGNGANPFAGTPLAPLGTLGAPGTPVGGPTGTPLDRVLMPLQTLLGTPAIGNTPAVPPLPLNAAQLASLGSGLATVGDAIVDGYNNIPGSSQFTQAGDVVMTLGNTLTDLSTALSTLDGSGTTTAGTRFASSLTSVANLLTAPTGLLGTLAAASGSSNLQRTVAIGSAQLDSLLSRELAPAINTAITAPASITQLNSTLTSLTDLGCALTVLGSCGTTSNTQSLTDLGNTLTDLVSTTMGTTSPVTTLTNTITSTLTEAATSNQTLITSLTSSIQTLPTSTTSTGGLTGLLGSLFSL